MQFNSTVNAQQAHPVHTGTRLPRRAIPLTVAATLAVILAAGVSHGVTAQDTPEYERPRTPPRVQQRHASR